MAGIKIGGVTPSAIYIGSTPVSKIYLGATQVWPVAGSGTALAGATYTFTGGDLAVFANDAITLDGAAFSLSGGVLTSLSENAILLAGPSYGLTGGSLTVGQNNVIVLDGAAYSVAGGELLKASSVALGGAAYSVSGGNLAVFRNDRIALDGASFALSAGALTSEGGTPDVLAPPTIDSTYAIAVDTTNDWPLYEKAADTVSDYPASVTKLMTALIVLRNKSATLSDTVTVQSGDLLDPSISQMGLQTDDVITFTDLLHGMLLPSGGDACQAAARVVGDLLTASGGVTRFITEMNSVATDLGMTNTAYTNTYGLAEDGHFTTARDLAKLMAEVLSESVLAEILGKSVYSAVITGTNARTIFLSDTNPINCDDGVLGGKTGTWIDTTPDPDINVYNLVNAWRAPNGNTVVIVTLEASSAADREADQRAIIAQLTTDFTYLDADLSNGAGYVLLEDGASKILLEDGSSFLLLE